MQFRVKHQDSRSQDKENRLFSPKGRIAIAGKDYITVGGLRRPLTTDVRQLIVGEPGSGKSVILRRVLHEVFSQIKRGGNTRAVIFDRDGGLLGDLEAAGTKYKILEIDNSDGAQLDFAKEFPMYWDCSRLAELLVPLPEKAGILEDQALAVRKLIASLQGVLMWHLSRTTETWTLYELLVMLLTSEERLRDVMLRYPGSKAVYDEVFGVADPAKASAMRIALASFLGSLRSALMNWTFNLSVESITLDDWSKADYVLVLRYSHTMKEASDLYNHLILSRVIDRLVESHSGNTWLFFDHLSYLPRVEGLGELLQRGRCQGVCHHELLQQHRGDLR